MLTHRDGRTARLLVVDDEYWSCRALKALFSKSLEVHTALSVAEARQLGALDAYDVAIVDYHMPEENGMGLVEQLRASLPADRIFLATADDSLETGGAGRYTYLAKPFEPKKLVEDVCQRVTAALGGDGG